MRIINLENMPGFARLECDEGYFLRPKGCDEITEARSALIRAEAAHDWEQVELASAQEAQAAKEREQLYSQEVVSRIRTRYSADDERAIMRKMLAVCLPATAMMSANAEGDADAEPSAINAEAAMAEFAEYNTFAEQCKAEAKEMMTQN